jgi:hypothetical protein
VQRELAEIVATPRRISLYGDGERCGYPEECRLCYNLAMLQGRYLRGANQGFHVLTFVKRLICRNPPDK